MTIAFGEGATQNFNVASTTLSLILGANRKVVHAISIRTASSTVSSLIDNQGNTYTFQLAQNSANSTARIELWALDVTTSGSTTFTLTLAAASKAVWCVGTYSGTALGFGGSGTSTAVSGTLLGTSIPPGSLQSSTSWATCGIAWQGTTTATQSAGVLRETNNTAGGSSASNEGGALNDNNVHDISGITNTIQVTANSEFSAAALELLPSGTVVLPKTRPLLGSGQ